MDTITFTKEFWASLDELVAGDRIMIDRPKGSGHPRNPEIIYPLDYGYLENTTAVDGGGVDVWVGTGELGELTALVCTVDLNKRDAEIKLLVGCSEAEIERILAFHNGGSMRAILVKR